MKRVSVLIPADHVEQLDDIASRSHRNFSQEIRRLVEERISEWESEQAAGDMAA